MVYFVQQGYSGPIKIGSTNDIAKRIAQLQTSSGQELRLLLQIDGDTSKESVLHEKFSPYRMKGEWFYPVKEILDFVSENKQNASDELSREEKEFRVWCHASCCCGETEIKTTRQYLLSLAQMALDAEGFGSGYFGKDDLKIKWAMIEFAEWYEDILHGRNRERERKKFFSQQRTANNGLQQSLPAINS